VSLRSSSRRRPRSRSGLLCRTLQVSRAGFTPGTRARRRRGRKRRPAGPRDRAIHAETRQRYGSPRIHAELADRGCRTSRKRVARSDAGGFPRGGGSAGWPLAPAAVPVTTPADIRFRSRPTSWRDSSSGPRRSSVGDRHYLHPDRRGLALPGGDPRSLLALRRRWAMSERITDDLALDAPACVARRRPPPGLLHHSDRGSQYASGDFTSECWRSTESSAA